MYIDIRDEFSLSFFGRSFNLALATHQCVSCGKSADTFKNVVSAEEYYISALCQKCQDEIFSESEKEQLDESDPFWYLISTMTLNQFQQAFAIAKDFNRDLSNVDDSILYGYGLASFKPVHTTLEAVAKTIRWQALMMNGEWDAEALNEVAENGRKNFLVLG